MQVQSLKRSSQDLFSSPGFLLHTFAAEPGLADPNEEPSTSGSAPPPHGLDLAKITQTYNALLQVSHATRKQIECVCECNCLSMIHIA